MQTRTWPRLIALLAATAMGVMTTGCQTSGGLASVPGFSWLSRNKQTATPSLLSSNDPAGQLPPPSAAADPYQNHPAGPPAGHGYPRSLTASNAPSAPGQYPSTGYPSGQPPRNAPRNYQTGPYNTGPVNSRNPIHGTPRQGRLAGLSSQNPYGSAESSRGGGTRYATPYNTPDRRGSSRNSGADRSVYGQGDRLNSFQTNTQGDNGLPYPRDNGSPYPRQAPGPYSAQPSSYSHGAYDGASTDTYNRSSRYSRGNGQASPWDSTTTAPNDNRYGQNDAQSTVSSTANSTAGAAGDPDQSLVPHGQTGAGVDHSNHASVEPRTSGASPGPLRSSQPWRPGSTSDYIATQKNASDSSRLQQASHLSDVANESPSGSSRSAPAVDLPTPD